MTRHRRGKRGRASPDPPAKRRRRGRGHGHGPGPPELEADELEAPPAPVQAPSAAAAAASEPLLVMVAGLPPGCGVMELKSRLGAYGPIARTRIDAASATGYVTFRSAAAAMAAIAASLDPDGGVTVGSKKVRRSACCSWMSSISTCCACRGMQYSLYRVKLC
jgi:hypothetical protein